MKAYKNKFLMIMLAAAIISLWSCAKEESNPPKPTPPEGQIIKTTVTLSAKKREIAKSAKPNSKAAATDGFSVDYRVPFTTRTGGTPLADGDEIKINDLWVVQLVPQSTGESIFALEPQYLDSQSLVDIGENAWGDYEYRATFYYVNTQSMMFYLANTGDPTMFDGMTGITEEELYAMITVPFADEASVTAGDKILMSGSGFLYSGDQLDNIDIYRATAKVQLSIQYSELNSNGNAFELTSVQLRNVPTAGLLMDAFDNRYFSSNDNTSPSLNPEFISYKVLGYTTTAEMFMDYDVMTTSPYGDGPLTDGVTFTWYMPENRRGHNLNILSQKNKYYITDPSYISTGVSYSTYIEMKGIYTPSSGSPTNVTLVLYPGSYDTYYDEGSGLYESLEPTITSFNIWRNTWYDITVNLSQLAGDDMRITMPIPAG